MSRPYNVSPPTLRQDGDKLVAANGSWMCDSGPVGGYLFSFRSGDLTMQPPQRETHEQARARLAQWPSNTLEHPRVGQIYDACVWAVTFSGAWGIEPPWAEWSAAAISNAVTVQAVAPPPPPVAPQVVPAEAELTECLNALHRSQAFQHHGVNVVEAELHARRALAFLRGENP